MTVFRGKLALVCGPSMSGKDTLILKYFESHSSVKKVISDTTRKPRKLRDEVGMERNGVDYNFLSEEEFSKREHLEAVEVFPGTWYGTPKEEIINGLENGDLMITDIDVDGAFKIREALKEIEMEDNLRLFFIDVPIRDLEARFKKSGDSNVKKRIKRSEYEKSFVDKFDRVILNKNNEFGKAYAEFVIELDSFFKLNP